MKAPPGMMQNDRGFDIMLFVGITGGIGAGKSEVLAFLEKKERVKVIYSDLLARELMAPGRECYDEVSALFEGKNIKKADGSFDRRRMARIMFKKNGLREKVNAIVHPAVKKVILRTVEEERKKGELDYLFLESAILLEDGYRELCDEIWYVYAPEDVRAERLKATRGYSDEKVQDILKNQYTDEKYRENADAVIENAADRDKLYRSIDAVLKGHELKEDISEDMGKQDKETEKKPDYVFGLDIGTRNVVGTVGELLDDKGSFHVIAQCSMEHETRAMLDGQIHDINRVANVVEAVKKELEEKTGLALTEVCIAAAGRVLRTITTRVEYDYEEETVVTGEDIHTMDLLGVDKAQQELKEENDSKYKFYCVGYSVMKYYLNGDIFGNLEGHKAERIEEDIIVTFLPEDVVDGLYSAVERAGLKVANLTLEPIAAINVAIPESFRMLNIALIDVGAGTSDICITKEGSIAAYGMIPFAGDELTEVLVQAYLVDFAAAEQIKKDSTELKEVTYSDIMGISHTVKAEEVWKLTDPVQEKITTAVAEKIKELNGDKTVSAAFVVGGGGKVHGFCENLAKKLDIPGERVALRGEEVMKKVTFDQPEVRKDPLLVTPIGICLNYFEQKNNFIMIHFNGEMMKLYDNGHLTVVDAALQAGFSTEELFPRRGKEIHFTVNGAKRMIRGEAGESAVVIMNDEEVGLNTPLIGNAYITIEASTAGSQAYRTIESLSEYTGDTVTFSVNNHSVKCPKFVEVNGSLEPGTYVIKEGDAIETRNYYTVGQLKEFMDVELDEDKDIYVNNRVATMDTLIYENFSIEWSVLGYGSLESEYKHSEDSEIIQEEKRQAEEEQEALIDAYNEVVAEEGGELIDKGEWKEEKAPADKDGITLYINEEEHQLTGKSEYIFVDIFNVIDFDTNQSNGRQVLMKVNGQKAVYTTPLTAGDRVEIGWMEK